MFSQKNMIKARKELLIVGQNAVSAPRDLVSSLHGKKKLAARRHTAPHRKPLGYTGATSPPLLHSAMVLSQ